MIFQEYKEYYDTQEFAVLAKKSEKTLGRLKEKLLKENPSTKKVRHKSKPHKFHHSLLKQYVSEEMYSLILRCKSMANTIKCLKRTASLEHKLFKLDWTWWCTVAYRYEMSAEQCRTQMDSFYEHITCAYGDSSYLRMYYTTESFNTREGNHNHFVLHVSNPELQYVVKKELENYFQNERLDVQDYDDNLPCIFYTGKEGHRGTAWDLFGNNLTHDGLQYEDKGKRASV